MKVPRPKKYGPGPITAQLVQTERDARFVLSRLNATEIVIESHRPSEVWFEIVSLDEAKEILEALRRVTESP